MQHPTSTTPRAEKQATRTRHRAIQLAQAGKTRADQRRRAQIIHDQLASPRAKDCWWPITPAGRSVCPTLDAIRRRLGT